MNHIKNHLNVELFDNLREGMYFRSVWTGALFVKRTKSYAESILLSGLADTASCWWFGPESFVEVLEESEWPKINYHAEIEGWNWDFIITNIISQNVWLDEEKNPQGRGYIGSIMSLTPSGKIYAMWTTNQTSEDVNRDGQWFAALEEVLGEKGMYLDGDSGDIVVCKSYTFEELARAAGYELGEYCGQYYWREIKDPTNTSVHFEDEDEAWEDCCMTNGLVQK